MPQEFSPLFQQSSFFFFFPIVLSCDLNKEINRTTLRPTQEEVVV